MREVMVHFLCVSIFVTSSVNQTIQKVNLSPAKDVNESPANICTTECCKEASSTMLNYMDETIDPCDDFYEFACGKYVHETTIPEDKSSKSSFSIVQDKVDEQLKNVLTEEALPNESKPFQLAKIFTKTCLDVKTLNEKGITPLVEILERHIDGWPVVKGNDWQAEKFDWLEVSKQISHEGLESLIVECGVTVDLKNTSKRVMSINRSAFPLSRKFLLQGMEHPFVKAYYEYMVDAAVLFGANRSSAEFELLDVLQFETELAKISLSDEERRNKTLTYNPFTIQDLQTTYPYINWLEFINWNLEGVVHVNESEVVIVGDKGFLQNLNGIIESTSKRTIANYFGWRLVHLYSDFTNDVLHERAQQYLAATTGKKKSLPRITECVKLTMAYLSFSAGASYVLKYFSGETRAAATTMAKTIHEQFIDTLHTVPWMEDESRTAAIEKANKMFFHVAYPDELIDDKKLDEHYRGLELQPDSLIGSMVRMHKFFEARAIRKLRLPVNKTDWETHSKATMVNAFYSLPENSIQLPAAVLQSPFFSVERPWYMNFGAIGWFVAHEITHGFDDEGRQFDSNGNVANWWQEDTITKFTSRADCFIEQYSSYKHPTLNMTVNGVNTQGENIADNGGIKGTYSAYQKFVSKNGADPILPDFNYTANQLFWISAAQVWCTVTRSEYDTMEYTTNVHSPAKFRVIGTFQNSESFSKDFKCAPGSKMNPTNKCAIW